MIKIHNEQNKLSAESSPKMTYADPPRAALGITSSTDVVDSESCTTSSDTWTYSDSTNCNSRCWSATDDGSPSFQDWNFPRVEYRSPSFQDWASAASDSIMESIVYPSAVYLSQSQYSTEYYECYLSEWKQRLTRGDAVDIYNPQTLEWCTGKVKRMDQEENKVVVMYDHYNDHSEKHSWKHDVDIQLESGLVAPLHTHTGSIKTDCPKCSGTACNSANGWNTAANAFTFGDECDEVNGVDKVTLCDQCWPHLS